MTRYSERPRWFVFLGWVKAQRCVVGEELGGWVYCDAGGRGWSEADHAGRRGYGQKSDDREAIPLCPTHHRERTDARGYFAGWDADRMRPWLDHWIAIVWGRWERLEAAGPLPF